MASVCSSRLQALPRLGFPKFMLAPGCDQSNHTAKKRPPTMFGLVKGESQPFFLKLRSLSSSSIPSLLLRVSIFIHHQVSIHPFILMNHCVTCNPHFHPCFSMLKHIPDLLKSVLSKASASPSRSTAALGVPAGSEKKSAAQHWPGPLLESLGAVETFSQWIGLREKLQVNPRFLPWHMDFPVKKSPKPIHWFSGRNKSKSV